MKDDNDNIQEIKIKSITLLNQSSISPQFYQEQYYLNILINNQIDKKSSPFKFSKDSATYELNLTSSFSDQLDTILFKLCESKKNTSIYQGTFTTLPEDLTKKGAIEYDCDIRNAKKEKIKINFIYINNEGIKGNKILKKKIIAKNDDEDIFNSYNKYLNTKSRENKEINDSIKKVSESSRKKSEVSILDLLKGKNAILFDTFVRKTDYIKAILNVVLDFIFWKNPYKTFSILSILTFIILYTNFFIFFISILLMILFHLSYRDTMEENFSYRNCQPDFTSNMQIILWIMEITNNSFLGWENLCAQLQNNSTELFKEVYLNLLKLLLWNIPLYFIVSYMENLINFTYVKIIGLWTFVLMQYPPFKAFVITLFKLISSIFKNFVKIGKKEGEKSKKNEKLIKIAEILIPFYKFGKEIYSKSAKDVLKRMNTKPEIILFQDKNDENKFKQMLKYEIYEKERWKILKWSKSLDENDGAPWVKKGNNKNIFFDKNKLELPGSEYEWKSEWTVEKSTNTDNNGWQYAKSFDDLDWKNNDINSAVRRRIWVKYAGLK